MNRREFITLLGGRGGYVAAGGARTVGDARDWIFEQSGPHGSWPRHPWIPRGPQRGGICRGAQYRDRVPLGGRRLPALAGPGAIGGDPVAPGLVASLNRPGGNVTGASFYTSPVVTKRLDLARELVPEGA
jgi:hypothetical protein